MDKLRKHLKRLSKKDQLRILKLIILIKENQLKGLDLRKIAGNRNLYRVRSGKLRVIFEKREDQNKIIKMDERDDQTYKNL